MAFENLLDESLTHICGFCGKESWFRRVGSVEAGKVPGDRVLGMRPYETAPIAAAIYQCGGCELASLFLFAARGSFATLLGVFPSGLAQPIADVPTEIAIDRDEAWNCHLAGQHRAAILMARSALQRAVRKLGGEGKSLYDELDSLVSRGIITKQLGENAHEVRLTGNDVAHPEDMSEVTKEDADDSLAFLDDFLRTTFAIPERQRRRKEARDKTDDSSAT